MNASRTARVKVQADRSLLPAALRSNADDDGARKPSLEKLRSSKRGLRRGNKCRRRRRLIEIRLHVANDADDFSRRLPGKRNFFFRPPKLL